MNAKQLKNAILQLAIQGKLVPQDPSDEPASALLAQIRKEKEQLVKAGKLKKKDLETTPITDEEKPFGIPESWEWCRLKDVFSMQAGKNINASELSQEKNETHSYLCYGGNGVRGYIGKYNYEGNFPIVGRQGALCGCVNMATGKFQATEHAVVVTTYAQTNEFWAYYFLTASNLNQYATATAQPGLSVANILETLIPLPPLAEQHHIVAKIEELMPLVEEYGEAQEKLNQLNEALPEALKKSILQQAIQGKLVPQDPTDEPASVLLAQIRKEKEQLLKAGKLKPACRQAGKKDLETTPISDEEKPFEIPKGWEWVRLIDISAISYGFPFDSQLFNEVCIGMPLIRIRDVVPGSTKTYTSEKTDERYIVKKGDMLVGMDGNFNVNFWNSNDAYLNQRVCKIEAKSQYLVQNYLYYYLPLALEDICNDAHFVTVKHLSDKNLRQLFIPLPPLAEQHRIVSKIEELMGMVEKIR